MKIFRHVFVVLIAFVFCTQLIACSGAKKTAQVTEVTDPDVDEVIPMYLYQVKKKTDTNGDLVFDVYETEYYNTDEQLTLSERDDNQDGVVDSSKENIYDDDGNLVTYKYRDSTNSDTHYTYDANNNLVKEEEDNGVDGTINAVIDYVYNAQNKLLEEKYDDDNNGTYEETYKYTYDVTGLLKLKVEFDQAPLGSVNYRTVYTYTPQGKIKTEFVDSDGNGVDNYRYYYFYNASNQLERREYDGTPATPSIGTINYYTYNENGNVTLEEDDFNNDGVIDREIVYTYQPVLDTFPDSFEPYTETSSTVDYYASGVHTFSSRYVVTADGRDVRYEVDADANGTFDRAQGQRYDEYKNEIQYYYDDNNDGLNNYDIISENFYQPLP